MTHSTPQAVMQRLAEIETDLASRENEYETAARDRARFTRDWDYRLALHMRKATGSNEATRKAHALVAAIEQDDLYERLTAAESAFEALRAVTRTLDTRATIGASILKAQGRG